MAALKLKASPRQVTGKKVRFLRRQGITPAHLYGSGMTSLMLQCDAKQLQTVISQAGGTRLVTLEIEQDKTPRNIFIREIQRDAITRELLHVDFYQVKKGEKISFDIPIVFTGEAPALKEKARVLSRGITTLSIECLPELVPPQIEVDLSPLVDTAAQILVKDIKLDPAITINNEPDQLIAKVVEIAEEVEVAPPVAAEAAEAAPAEGEAPAQAQAEEKKAEKAAPEKPGKPEKA